MRRHMGEDADGVEVAYRRRAARGERRHDVERARTGRGGYEDLGVVRGAALAQRGGDRLEGERAVRPGERRSEEHTSELQSLMRISYAVFCLKNKKNIIQHIHI